MALENLSIHTYTQKDASIKKNFDIHIETTNHVVKPIRASDVTDEFRQWFDDPQMLQGLNISAINFSLDGLKAFVASFNNENHFLIGIFDKKTATILGFYNFTINPQHRVATLTLGVSPKIKTGRFILKETWPSLCDLMFQNKNIEKITSRVLTSNKKLIFTLINAEYFIYEATLKQEILGKNGQRVDVMVISCFKDKRLRPK